MWLAHDPHYPGRPQSHFFKPSCVLPYLSMRLLGAICAIALPRDVQSMKQPPKKNPCQTQIPQILCFCVVVLHVRILPPASLSVGPIDF